MSYVTQLYSVFSNEILGILLPIETTQEENNKRLENWHKQIWVLSDFETNFSILRDFAQQNIFSSNVESFNYNKRQLTVRTIDLEKYPLLGVKPDFVVISDATEDFNQLNSAIMRAVVSGISVLIFSEFILIGILMGQVKNLINIAAGLKYLPQLEYQKARSILSRKPSFFRDEVTSLQESANFVINALEQLQQDVKEKNLSLQQQFNTVTRSQAFLSRLLDNSQLFILTQTFDGQVLTRNIRINEIMPDSENDFCHCASAKEAFAISKMLQKLKTKEKNAVNFEGHCLDVNGKEMYIAWTHTTVEDELGQTVVLSIGNDLTKRKEAENALTWMALNDPLTGISNRRGFQQKIDELVLAQRHFSLVFIDINRFKQINDIYGHSTGDIVLMNIAKQLKLITRQTDHVSRLAGDEFTILLTRTSLKEIEPIVKKVSEALQGQLKLEDGKILEYNTSVGAAVFPTHADDSETLIIYADMAMYQAKKKSGDNWHIYQETDEQLAALQIEHHYSGMIKDALKNEQFRLVYQPIIDIESKVIKHYEVLLRILSDQGRLVFPGEFIPIAEKNGLIRTIDEWVVDNALKNLSEVSHDKELSFGVNISAPSLQAMGFPEFVFASLEKYQVSPNRLIIELTETAYIENFNQVLENLEELHQFGVKVALDDFGVGFSSFNYLKRLPLSYVKLDGSYIKNLCENRDDQAFVKSLSEMVQAFGMKTIAEFVEDQKTMLLLKELGVNYAQGFYIGRPEESLLEMVKIADLN